MNFFVLFWLYLTGFFFSFSSRLLLWWAHALLEERTYRPWQMKALLCASKEPFFLEDLRWFANLSFLSFKITAVWVMYNVTQLKCLNLRFMHDTWSAYYLLFEVRLSELLLKQHKGVFAISSSAGPPAGVEVKSLLQQYLRFFWSLFSSIINFLSLLVSLPWCLLIVRHKKQLCLSMSPSLHIEARLKVKTWLSRF